MTEPGRSRLLGALILVSLAAIFLPMLFDGAGIERREVPRMPASGDPVAAPVERLDTRSQEWAFVDEAQRRRADETGGDVVGMPRHEEVSEAEFDAAVEAGPGLDASGAPRAFAVQLATFAQLENADRLRQRLLEDGFQAYVIETRRGGRLLHRVAVGPELDPAVTRRLRDALAERYELEGILVRYAIGGRG